MSTIPELEPRKFAELWPGFPDDGVVLLDVREPQEIALAAVEGALHIPMGEIPGRLDEIDPNLPTVVMCHGGGRSLRVAEFLRVSGFGKIYNLAGGIDAWSIELDSAIPRY